MRVGGALMRVGGALMRFMRVGGGVVEVLMRFLWSFVGILMKVGVALLCFVGVAI